jgi:putative NADPH-quinone reductase
MNPQNTRILLIQGHPDALEPHFCDALADAYATGALHAGHEVRRADVARINFPLLSSQREWKSGALPDSLRTAQEDILWSNHIVLFFPLWLGGMPAMVRGFLEQVLRPDFAFGPSPKSKPYANKKLTGRSARVVVTMGMPAMIYRLYFRAHSLKALERNILGFVGISPIRETLIGGVESLKESEAADWVEKLHQLGREGI